MSGRGTSERLRYLREAIAGIEQAGGGMAPAPVRRLAFGRQEGGRQESGFSFDRLLGGLATGALYEVAPARMGDLAAATGFALGLAARFGAEAEGALIWVSDEFSAREHGAPYGPGLAAHGLDMARIVFVRAQGGQDLLWALEEALRCGAAAAVIADLGGAARLFDLVAARRITQAARGSGTPAILLHPPASFQRVMAQNGARMRFEIKARSSVIASAQTRQTVRPVPGAAHFGVRLAKPGVTAGQASGLDTELVRTIIWDHGHGYFRDALSLAASAASGARDRSAQSA